MPVLGIIVFCTVFSLGYTAALAWVLERKESRYGQGSYSFTDVFLPASLTLIVVYFLNIVLLIRYARLTLPVDGALCAALALFWSWRERKFKASAARATAIWSGMTSAPQPISSTCRKAISERIAP